MIFVLSWLILGVLSMALSWLAQIAKGSRELPSPMALLGASALLILAGPIGLVLILPKGKPKTR